MDRIALSGGREWFDKERAESFNQARYFDGNNMISRATGSQWHDETLYRTASGNWVLHHSPRVSGQHDSYRKIDSEEAAAWLLQNEHTEIPAILEGVVAAAEV